LNLIQPDAFLQVKMQQPTPHEAAVHTKSYLRAAAAAAVHTKSFATDPDFLKLFGPAARFNPLLYDPGWGLAAAAPVPTPSMVAAARAAAADPQVFHSQQHQYLMLRTRMKQTLQQH
jgi:hypothetical protein